MTPTLPSSMTQTLSACPDASLLTGLLDGALPPAEETAVSKHLETCTHCQQTLEKLAAGGATWDVVAQQLRRQRSVVDQPTPPQLAAAMAALKTATGSADQPAVAADSFDLPAGFLAPSQTPGNLGRLGHYEVIEEIGRGAMGIVLRAFDEKLHRTVALKIMAPQLAHHATSRQRFVREGQAAAAVCHEHVVTIYAVEEAAGLPYLAMQYISGQSLQQRLERTGPLRTAEVLRIGMQAAAGLAAAHAQGLVHRDIKPANLLLENGVERVKITDFGLARAVDDASLTQSGVISGTPQYMAPEQARGEAIGHRSDLFSLGCVLYELCTGRPPFRAATTMAVLKRICDDQPRPIRDLNPETPEWLAGIVLKLLAKNPDDRFQSAGELSELLANCLAHVQQPEQVALPNEVRTAAVAASNDTTPTPSRSTRPWYQQPAVLILAAVLPLSLVLLNQGIDWMLAPRADTKAESTLGANGRSDLKKHDPAMPAPVPSAPTPSDDELAELERLVGIAQKQALLARTQYERGVVSLDDVLQAEVAHLEARVRWARAAGERDQLVKFLREIVAHRQQQLDYVVTLIEAGRITLSERLEAERRLSEARLELSKANGSPFHAIAD